MNTPFTFSDDGNIQVLRVSNLLSEHNNKKILKAAESKIEEGFPNFVVDLEDMDYMNSVGLNFLLILRTRTRESGGGIAVANASKKVLELFEMTKLKKMFHLTNSVEEAIQSYFNNNE